MERKLYRFESIILSDVTREVEGFDPDLIGYQKKHIWARCRFCGNAARILGANFKKAGSACHKECRLQEQSILGSPFSNPETKAKAIANRTKNVSQKEINQRISHGRQQVQLKIEQTNIEKYGVTNPFGNKDIQKQIRDSNIEKYGVPNPQQSLSIREQTRKTFQNTIKDDEDHYRLVNVLRSEEFWKLLADPNYTINKIAEHFNVKYKSILGRIQHDEFRERYYNTYTFPSQQQQREISDFIKELGFSIIENDRSIIKPLELDIYIPSKRFAIEFNGSAWHSEMKLDKEDAEIKHFRKTNMCITLGVRLVHIFERQWETRKDQWKIYLRSALGKNEIFIPARKCSIEFDGGKKLIEDSHIQGCPSHLIKTIDLIHNGEITGTIGIAKHHRDNGDKEAAVLSRMAFAKNTTIQGGAAKLLSAMIKWSKENGFKRILSWSDNAWTDGSVYPKIGFLFDGSSGPDYFYWNSKENEYVTKQSQKKSITGCPKVVKERDWAFQNGLYKIWDCGKKSWILELEKDLQISSG